MRDPGHLLPPPTEPRDSSLSLRELWRTLVRGRWLVIGVMLVVVALAALLTLLLPPSYQSQATLRIGGTESGPGMLGDLAPLKMLGLPGLGDDEIDTDIGVLRSRQIAEAVADSLRLHVRLTEPQGPRDSLLQVLRAPRDLTEATFALRRQPDGSFAVQQEKGRVPIAHPERIEPGQPFQLGVTTLALAPLLRDAPPRRITIELVAFDDAVEELREDLRVARHAGRSKLVDLRYRSADRQLAAAVPNVAAHSFVEYKSHTNRSESRSMVEVLREQVASYETQLRGAEDRLRGFREQHQVVSIPDEATQQVRRLAEVQVQRDGLQVERESLARLLARVRERPPQREDPSPYRELATFPSFISNRAVQDILHSLVQIENERAALLVRRTPENADVRGLTERVEELEQQLYRFGNSYLESLDNQIVSTGSFLTRFGGELGALPAREVEFVRLTREQKLLNEVYLFLQTRLKEAEIQEAIEPEGARVIDSALVPKRPTSPRPLLNLMLAMVAGLMLGVTAALGRQALDTKVRSRMDAEAASGGLPVLGVIPRIPAPPTSRDGSALGRIRRGRLRGELDAEPLRELLIVRSDPQHPAAEAYRALRTSIAFATAEPAPQILVVTSAVGGDGTSVSASNLAITLAQQGTRVLLIDADLRHGMLHRAFDVPRAPGFAQLLRGDARPAEAVHQVEVGDGVTLDFLPAGSLPPNPAQLLGSPRIRQVLEQMREHYEMIVLDAPPLNLAADAAVLGTAADAAILIARAGITEKETLQDAAAQLYRLRVPVIGLVLTDHESVVRPDHSTAARVGATNGRFLSG